MHNFNLQLNYKIHMYLMLNHQYQHPKEVFDLILMLKILEKCFKFSFFSFLKTNFRLDEIQNLQ